MSRQELGREGRGEVERRKITGIRHRVNVDVLKQTVLKIIELT